MPSSPHRRMWIDRAAVLLLTGVAMLASSCSEKPVEVEFTNVLDPDLGFDLMSPRVFFQNRAVAIVWDHLLAEDLGEEVTNYTVFRSARPDVGFAQASTRAETTDEDPGQDDDEPGTRTAVDVGYIPDTVNYYTVGFTLESGRQAPALGAPMVSVRVPPRVQLSGTGAGSATRYPNLLARSASSIVGHVSSDPLFGEFTEVTLTRPDARSDFNEASVPWDLGPTAANGDTIFVYMRTPRSEGGFSVTDTLAVEASLHPALGLVETVVFQPHVRLRVPITGVVRMRFATTAAGLDAASWMVPDPPDTTVNIIPFQLSSADPTPQVWAQYEGDFGFEVVESTTVIAAGVESATLTIDGGAEFTTDANRMVKVVSQVANATLMRLSESPDFTGVPWVAYEDTVSVQLSPSPGLKTVYGWYTNVYDPVGQATSDDIILVGETLR